MITVKAKYNIDLGKSVTNANADLLNGTLNESGTITTFTPIKAITGSGNNSFSHNGNGATEIEYFTESADEESELFDVKLERKLSYSTNEEFIGYFLNTSEKVYKRLFVFDTALSLETDTYTVTSISNSGMLKILDCKGISALGTYWGFLTASIDTGDYVRLLNIRSSTISVKYLILTYTKSS